MAMKWILYVMLFTAPAANITNKKDVDCLKIHEVTQIDQIGDCRKRFEAKQVWSLQAASQTEFQLFDSCVRMQDLLTASSNVASTMTLRAWCFCESTDWQCPSQPQLIELAKTIRACEKAKKEPASCHGPQANIALEAVKKSGGGQNASSIRLFPPQ